MVDSVPAEIGLPLSALGLVAWLVICAVQKTKKLNAVDVAEEQKVLEAHDFELSCQVAELMWLTIGPARVPLPDMKRCSAPAAWLAMCRTCGAKSYTCSAHRELQADHLYAECERCGDEGSCDMVFTFVSLDFTGAR